MLVVSFYLRLFLFKSAEGDKCRRSGLLLRVCAVCGALLGLSDLPAKRGEQSGGYERSGAEDWTGGSARLGSEGGGSLLRAPTKWQT